MKKYTVTSFSRVSYLLLFFLAGSLFFLSSCEKEDEFTGTPVITQVRLLNPLKRDSSFTSARPSTQILIEGQNLGGIKNVYFNEYEAGFNTVYNTNNNLIVTIPSNAPTEATNAAVPNTLRIVTSHGEVTYNFVLDIPPPVISYIVNENALPGETFTVVGSNLWLIEKVVFPGNREITTFTSNEDGTELLMTMPDLGTESGKVTIVAKYGSVTSAAPVNMFIGEGMISNRPFID